MKAAGRNGSGRSGRRQRTMETRIYLDHAATTPVRDEVVAAMMPYFGTHGFNASSPYAEGRAARAALDAARATVGRLLGAQSREIVFTGGGSEADNLAIFGTARARRAAGNRIVTVATEHHAVLHAMDVLRDDGFTIDVLPVDSSGRVDPAEFARALVPGTILASVMLANNELGTVQPIAELAALARSRDVTFHCDAVQAPGRLPLDMRELGVDLLALSGHKFYAPKGVGALYVRAGTPLAPRVVGGGQEAGLRAGTENVAGIVGFARGLELAALELPLEAARLRMLRDRFETALEHRLPGIRVHARDAERLPNLTSVAFAGARAQDLLVLLDLDGLAVSAGSACAAGSSRPSHVLAAAGVREAARFETLRFSFGKLTRGEEADRALEIVVRAVEALRDPSAELGTTSFGAAVSRTGVSI
jgi:cysteine desulfurase